ncbi:endonuclease [Tenacibaculum finnmarkense genomovar finnmarkense]|uniref:endonuclease/exonuclease/phosphatase family protein n=1 Tax=Tenacibaculum finnmarkense TaxID=2781243 RepID=UPI00187BBC84|nr:endonuclease/exonuclease/phosphatase family protein [Tenacibaculum finnmarkense]MBE7659695.1 endonuclease [Tenacibaculum finnmarkense genomovar finnmarkense]MCD8417234.1 endonuclease [Tenacibaculum finnmarkense genomovar finnmarkense]MCG8185617.1 endonuclease [Tenacibaculum finnmarkense genomovar finnmarkense]MCG8209547.1 endonuclease [Tenacibaculum finnmarkense genomovar finnmarkense]MCG8212345.1 endonuclease [Tenacibaculum finnmarkense genomovar finnmarkense]
MSKSKRKNIFTIAFYNVENLFDTVDNPKTADDDFIPSSRRKWNHTKYLQKIKKITDVIRQLGTNESAFPPVIVGLVEIENAKVIKDLTRHKNLSKYNYSYVHYDSPDERGIDVALLYNKDFFNVISSDKYPLYLTDDKGEVDYTRDLLVVKGTLNGELIHILVNHWPSRRDGDEETTEKRIKAAKHVHKVLDAIKAKEENPKFIIMGDFNDDPTSKSVNEILVTDDLFNPMKALFEKGEGTLTYYKKWHLFDQIIFSKDFFHPKKSVHTFLKAGIFKKQWLQFAKGKFKNSPFRTYIGPWYQGGFSDHFPVYVTFRKNKAS